MGLEVLKLPLSISEVVMASIGLVLEILPSKFQELRGIILMLPRPFQQKY